MRPGWFSRLDAAPQGNPLYLEMLAWPDAAGTLGETLLLPIGATEQHGPHLPLNTDTVIAQASCALASAHTGAPVLPPLNYTASLGHTEKWPGTFAIFHETLMQTVREIAAWAAASGWKRLLVINSHFGNDAPLRCAIDRLRFEFASRFLIATRNTWSLTPEIAAQFASDARDWHANDAETSLLLCIAPESVRMERIAQADDTDRTDDCIFPHMVANTSLNGVTGAPSQATAAKGAKLMAEIGAALAALVGRARGEQPPLEWTRDAAFAF